MNADPLRGDIYLQGTDRLCQGDAEGAVAVLESVPAGQRTPEHDLALAKAYLEVERGEDAAQALEALLEAPPEDLRQRAYLQVLFSAALARCGRVEEAVRRLEDVAAGDAQLERAARALRKRVEDGEPPLVRL